MNSEAIYLSRTTQAIWTTTLSTNIRSMRTTSLHDTSLHHHLQQCHLALMVCLNHAYWSAYSGLRLEELQNLRKNSRYACLGFALAVHNLKLYACVHVEISVRGEYKQVLRLFFLMSLCCCCLFRSVYREGSDRFALGGEKISFFSVSPEGTCNS